MLDPPRIRDLGSVGLSREISKYFDATEFRATRDELKQGIQLVQGPRVATECGCGAGSDIAFLRANGFTVHAFDIEQESIARCQKRFGGDSKVKLSHESFSTFEYPKASLVVTDASLFFCPETEFDEVWGKIRRSLLPNGIFVGSFLGPEDTMAGPDYDKEAFWPDVLVTNEKKVKFWFEAFEIVTFTEHKSSGETVNGSHHQWHIYSVVAKKVSTN